MVVVKCVVVCCVVVADCHQNTTTVPSIAGLGVLYSCVVMQGTVVGTLHGEALHDPGRNVVFWCSSRAGVGWTCTAAVDTDDMTSPSDTLNSTMCTEADPQSATSPENLELAGQPACWSHGAVFPPKTNNNRGEIPCLVKGGCRWRVHHDKNPRQAPHMQTEGKSDHLMEICISVSTLSSRSVGVWGCMLMTHIFHPSAHALV